MATETKTVIVTTCDICHRVITNEEKYNHDNDDLLNFSFKDDKKGTCVLKFKPDCITYSDGKNVQVGVDICKDCLKSALDQMLRRICNFKVNINYPEDPSESFAAHMGH